MRVVVARGSGFISGSVEASGAAKAQSPELQQPKRYGSPLEIAARPNRGEVQTRPRDDSQAHRPIEISVTDEGYGGTWIESAQAALARLQSAGVDLFSEE